MPPRIMTTARSAMRMETSATPIGQPGHDRARLPRRGQALEGDGGVPRSGRRRASHGLLEWARSPAGKM